MRSFKRTRTLAMRILPVGAAAAAMAVTGVAPAAGAAPQAAPTYWSFKNVATKACLTASEAHNTVFMAPCRTNWAPQQWDFIGGQNKYGQHMLGSVSKGLCLTGALEPASVAKAGVWLDSCNGGPCKWWDLYTPSPGVSQLEADYDQYFFFTLRASPATGSDSVFVSNGPDDEDRGIPFSNHQWTATHT